MSPPIFGYVSLPEKAHDPPDLSRKILFGGSIVMRPPKLVQHRVPSMARTIA